MLLQAALNGPLTKDDHPAVPITPAELRADAEACERAGARAFHVHPRDEEGRERMLPAVVDRAVAAVRNGTRWPVGVTSDADIEMEARRRVTFVQHWREPDCTSVNLHEADAVEIARAALGARIGVEAGLWSVEDAEILLTSGLADRIDRVLVEPAGGDVHERLETAAAIHAVLDHGGVEAPRLQVGAGAAAWPLLEDAVRRGIDARIGFEDTLLLPDGSIAARNADLVAAARAIGAGAPD
ncbi:MAG TPA: 3-keto-5-aminohexanoate cleavage protein [Amnibacterium sp.]|jgi:uncharacterized protein (DUF849 family)|uniref:3-keto-5-aminohexanoate cleavage protein n=1 Tax=Amnibacterium sp. TaxID=1872496 RepID=UPI002F924D7D